MEAQINWVSIVVTRNEKSSAAINMKGQLAMAYVLHRSQSEKDSPVRAGVCLISVKGERKR